MRSEIARTVVRILAVLLCIVGVVLSFYLLHGTGSKTAAHPDQGGLAALLDKGCTTIISTADCDKVTQSYWGTIPGLGVKTALLGLYYFTGLFWWFLLVGPVSFSRRGIHLVVAAIIASGLGFSIFLVYQMSRDHWCTWCLFTHAANALLFACMLLVWPRRPRIVGVSAPGLRSNPKSEGLFGRPAAGVAVLEQDWPTGWALLVMPIIVLLSFALETFALQPGGRNPELEGLVKLAQQEAEMYKKMVAGSDVAAEVEQMQMQIQDLKEALQRAGAELRAEATKRENERKTTQDQIDVLQKAAQGKPAADELSQLRTKLQTAEGYRDFYEKQFKRYDSRWQHTYTAWLITPPVKISMDKARVMGPANARHTLTIYSDYQCPTCRSFEETLKSRIIPLAERYGGLRVVFKMWPISTKCNSAAKRDLHPAACDAALAAQAAFMLGGNDAFWKMHELLFANQDAWKASRNFDSYATQIGLNLEAFRKAMQSNEALAAIKADIAEGIGLGKDLLAQGLITQDEQEAVAVDSTPSIFVDNKRLQSAHHFRTWQTILQGTTPEWMPETRRTTTQPAGGQASPSGNLRQ